MRVNKSYVDREAVPNVWSADWESATTKLSSIVRRTTADLVVVDRSWRRWGPLTLNVTRSLRYGGERLWIMIIITILVTDSCRARTEQCACSNSEQQLLQPYQPEKLAPSIKWWKIVLAAYPQTISGYNAERIIKIGQYLPKLENVAIIAMYCHLRPPDATAFPT